MIRRTPVDSPFARMIDRMIDHAARDVSPYASGEFATDTALSMDIEDTESHYVITADLPGVNPDNINIDMHDGILTISAETKEESRSEKGRMVLQERRFGKYSRSMRFPVAVNPEGIEADYDDGVLRVRVSKAAEAQPRRINVKKGGTIGGSVNGNNGQ